MKEQISDMVILNLLLQQGTPTNEFSVINK